ncbi:hypothetical protein GCM10011419_29930 [Vogesella fluminis]|uniref:Uncharacterized protein n=2 Tax=Vogesella fluminis TaxID=1069161 RepID=A0ABQ3HE88_9NEIS|nr:hypothetical protein GCM10011419_29930 [Vogesella fluminis]
MITRPVVLLDWQREPFVENCALPVPLGLIKDVALAIMHVGRKLQDRAELALSGERQLTAMGVIEEDIQSAEQLQVALQLLQTTMTMKGANDEQA